MEKIAFETYLEVMRSLHEAGFTDIILDVHNDTADIYINDYWISADALAGLAEDINFKLCPASFDGRLMLRLKIVFEED